ncbi:hypothetical protein VTL71DRAFT_11115 [Oculimacula yallundae]|uniref:Uncharacterized protein n=1 Tax=Oculimacula yallundae TaxID=86028 RepID=A0ABR4CXK6_9HELO
MARHERTVKSGAYGPPTPALPAPSASRHTQYRQHNTTYRGAANRSSSTSTTPSSITSGTRSNSLFSAGASVSSSLAGAGSSLSSAASSTASATSISPITPSLLPLKRLADTSVSSLHMNQYPGTSVAGGEDSPLMLLSKKQRAEYHGSEVLEQVLKAARIILPEILDAQGKELALTIVSSFIATPEEFDLWELEKRDSNGTTQRCDHQVLFVQAEITRR